VDGGSEPGPTGGAESSGPVVQPGGNMQTFDAFYTAVVEILRSQDEAAALALLGLSAEASTITLLEGETTAAEALAYARVMFEIGMAEVAHDVVRAVLTAATAAPTTWVGARSYATA
jgi:hypothetical protein